MRSNTAVVLIALCSLAAPVAAQEKETIQLPGAADGLPFSTAVRVGDMLYLSGQIGTTPEGLVDGGIEAETRQTLENIKRVLEHTGSSLDRVVKCTVFLSDIGNYSAMNAVYRTYFSSQPPARSTVAGSGLALGAAVEIECMALAGTG